MDIYKECFPLPAPDGFLVITGVEVWDYIKGKRGGSVVLDKDQDLYVFGLKSTGINNTDLDGIKSSFFALAGIKLICMFNATKEFEPIIPEEFDINIATSWIPSDGKFVSLHHYMAANLKVSLINQNEENETHYVECGICKFLKQMEMPMTILDLYLHGQMEHVTYCNTMTVLLSLAKPNSDITKLEYSFVNEYRRLCGIIEESF